MRQVDLGIRTTLVGMGINLFLAAVKISAGAWGNSYALIADGVESLGDTVTSLVVIAGLRISRRPPDTNHPYGHGRADTLAATAGAAALLGAAGILAFESVRQILTPHKPPHWITLVVLPSVILIKEALFRRIAKVGQKLQSQSITADAWHHRSDGITSLAVFIGIAVALIGGPGYESADDWAALIACALIAYNGVALLRRAIDEIMDLAPAKELETSLRAIIHGVPGVMATDKCRIRKTGWSYIVDVHVVVNGDISVHAGHEIAHRVKDALCDSTYGIADVIVHVEPFKERPAV